MSLINSAACLLKVAEQSIWSPLVVDDKHHQKKSKIRPKRWRYCRRTWEQMNDSNSSSGGFSPKFIIGVFCGFLSTFWLEFQFHRFLLFVRTPSELKNRNTRCEASRIFDQTKQKDIFKWKCGGKWTNGLDGFKMHESSAKHRMKFTPSDWDVMYPQYHGM